MQSSTVPAGRASTSFGIYKSDVPITTVVSAEHPIREFQHELDSTELPSCMVATSGSTTIFEAMPGPQPPIAAKSRPLRVPQPPAQSALQPMGLRPRHHCATPSTSSLNSTTTFPSLPHPGSTSSLPAFQNLPVGVRHSAQPSLSSSTLPSYSQLAGNCVSSTLPHRRPQPPTEGINGRPPLMHVNSSNSMSRADLMEIARRKQVQIDSNRDYMAEMDRQKAALYESKRHGMCVPAEIEQLRHEIQRDEQTVERLGAAKRDVHAFSVAANQQRQLIQEMRGECIGKEIDLRKAADQIHSLRQQRDLMHQRRAAAASAAIERQRRLNGMHKSTDSTRLATVDEIYGQVNKPMVRPRASVGPFQIKSQTSNSSIYETPKPPSYDEVDAMRQLQRIPMRTANPLNLQPNVPRTESAENPWVFRTSAVDTFVLRSDSLKAAKRRSWACDPQTRTHNSVLPSVTSTPTTLQPKRVVVAPTSAIVTTAAPPPTVQMDDHQSTAAEVKEPQRKPRKNVLFSSLFGRRSGSKDAKKTSASTTSKSKKTAEGTAEVMPKQEPLMPMDEPRDLTPTPQSTSTSAPSPLKSTPEKRKVEPEAKLPDLPTTKIEVAPSPLRCPLAAADDDEEETADEAELTTSVTTPQTPTPGVTTILLDTRSDETEETPDRELSASPPEDPQMRDDESTTSSVEDDPTPVAAQTPPSLSRDEHRMLAATSEIMRQLSELEVDNVKPVDAGIGRTEPQGTEEKEEAEILPSEYLIDEANRAATIIRQRHNRYEYEEDELNDEELLHDDGVQIRPYVVVERENLDGDELDDEERQTTTEEASSNDGESTATDEPQFDEIARPPLKGILKAAGVERPKKKMIFDPLIIFLDAALEGELDLVTETAEKIPDISQANEEGITALHNAICAGHYEIVKFLIQKHADVNAQDADGWTPLHCAASCNNLPLAKLLIENGACVFAMSLSDGETPAQKYEDCGNGYDGCAAYLESADKCMGVINSQKIFAVFAYETDRADELPFAAGDELRVLSRETGERGVFHQLRSYMYDDVQLPLPEDCLWWLCENGAGQRGLVPRNFFSLYPAWPASTRHPVETFELPPNAVALDSFLKKHAQTPDTTVGGGGSADESSSSRRGSTATLDPCDGNQSSSGSPDSAASSDQHVRDEDSPPPLPKPEFDANVQISAHA